MELRETFDMFPSDGKLPCPDCGNKNTEPYPGCFCRNLTIGKKWAGNIMPSGFHINKYHHSCPN